MASNWDRLDLSLRDSVQENVELYERVRPALKLVTREVLLTLRALIDWYLERLDRGERKPEVEEIRID